MYSNSISAAFGLSKMTVDSQLPIEVEDNGTEKMAEDFDKARSNIDALTSISMKAVQDLNDLAMTSQLPKYYEVLNNTLKTAVDANRTLVELHRELREAAKMKQPPGPQSITNNLVLTTSELQEMLMNAKRAKLD